MCLVNNVDVNGLSEVDENDSQDTLANDDDAHKAVLSALSLIPSFFKFLYSRNQNHKHHNLTILCMPSNMMNFTLAFHGL